MMSEEAMAYTQEEIKAMEPRALEGEIAVALFGFRWWAGHAYGGMGTLHRGLFPEQPEHIKGILRLATGEEPLYSDWHWKVPKYTTWENMPLVVAAMEARGWYWNVGQRVIHIKGAQLEMEWYAAFRQSARIDTKIRVIATPTSAGLPIATAQAALWTLQPWENDEQ